VRERGGRPGLFLSVPAASNDEEASHADTEPPNHRCYERHRRQPGLGALLSEFGTVCPTEEEAPCPADLNGDGVVDGADLGMLLGAWG